MKTTIKNKILSATADTILEIALETLGWASSGGTYQAKAPEALLKYAEKHNKK